MSPAEGDWIWRGADNLCLMTDAFYSYDNSENNRAAQVRLIEDDNVVKKLE
jgi:hypothetical protein